MGRVVSQEGILTVPEARRHRLQDPQEKESYQGLSSSSAHCKCFFWRNQVLPHCQPADHLQRLYEDFGNMMTAKAGSIPLQVKFFSYKLKTDGSECEFNTFSEPSVS